MSNTLVAAVTPSAYTNLGAGPMTVEAKNVAATTGASLSWLFYSGSASPGNDNASKIIGAREPVSYTGTDNVYVKAGSENMDFLVVK